MMARKRGRPANVSASASSQMSPIDRGSPKKRRRIGKSRSSAKAETKKGIIQASSAGGSSCGGARTGGADDAEADDEEDDDDSDEFAPSGRATKRSGGQAGRLRKINYDQVGKKGKDRVQKYIATSEEPKLLGHTPKTFEKDDSNSEAYDGVDEISNLDEDEPSLEQLEEMNIIWSVEGRCASETQAIYSETMSDTSNIGEDYFGLEDSFCMSGLSPLQEIFTCDNGTELLEAMRDIDQCSARLSNPRSVSPRDRPLLLGASTHPVLDPFCIVAGEEDVNGLPNRSIRSDAKASKNEESSTGTKSCGYECGFTEMATSSTLTSPCYS